MLRRIASISAFILLVALAVIFTALNPKQFAVDFAVMHFEVSSGLALLIAFSAGLLGGAVWRSNWIARLLAERRRLRDALRVAEERNRVVAASSDEAGLP
jgi:CBS domain containing-hemolysin-like protein